MTDFRDRYKRIGFGREDIDINRAMRSQRRDEARREMRSEHFSVHRNIEVDQDDTFEREEKKKQDENDISNAAEELKKKAASDLEEGIQKRLQQLEKWREERNRKKLLEKKKAKPVFKVGVVHHKVYSPPMNKEPVPPPPRLCKSKEVHHEAPPPKRVTRATEKRLASKTLQQKRDLSKSKKKVEPSFKDKVPKVPLAPKDHQFKVPVGVTPIPMFGRQVLEATKANLEWELHSKSHEVSSTSEFSKSLNTQSVLLSNNHSIILSKSNDSPKSNNLDSQICDSTVDKSLNDSSNDTSLEAVSLKISSDDQEMLDDQENVDNNCKMDSKNSSDNRRSSRTFKSSFAQINSTNKKNIDSPKNSSLLKQTRRRSKSIAEPATESPISKQNITKSQEKPEEQEKMEDEEIVESKNDTLDSSISKQNRTKSQIKRRSTRIIAHETASSQKIAKDDTFTLEDEEMLDILENLESNEKIINSQIENILPRSSTLKSPVTKRRSFRKFSEVKNLEFEQVSKDESFILEDKEETLNSRENNDSMKSSFSKTNQRKSSARRKSINFKSNSIDESTKENDFVKEMNSRTIENEEVSENLQKSGLEDSSISKQNKTKSPVTRRRSARVSDESATNIEGESNLKNIEMFNLDSQMEITILKQNKSPKRKDSIKIVPEESLIKFSPRQSEIIQSKKSAIKISPTKQVETLNESSSSEPKIRKLSGNDSHNLSLEMSLPKDSTLDKPPAFFSPYIVSSRGKSSVRKEIKRRFSQVSPDDIPTKDTVMQTLNISVEEEQRTAQYYKYILDKEIDRLNELCEEWNKIKEDESIPEEIHYEIQAAVGQTRLLINKKFERFRGLVLDCETGKGEMLVTCKDLQGFWEMMYMEIRDCDNRFNRLDKLKAENWVEEQAVVNEEQPIKKKPITKKPAAKKKVPAAKTSSLRAHIMAARKKIKNDDVEGDVEMKEAPIIETNEEMKEETANEPNEASILSKNRRTSTPKYTNKWQSLLKKVHSSQTKKSTTSPLIVMKLSQMCKTPEVQLDDSIIYINSDRTPAKSILKTSKDDTLSFIAKSANKVFFKEQPYEVQEFNSEVNNEHDMSTDDNEEPPVQIERKLNFESDSFNSSQIDDTENNEKSEEVRPDTPTISLSPFNLRQTIPNIVISDASPMITMSPLSLEENKSSIGKSLKKTKKQISFEDSVNEGYSRSLRSSKFKPPLTPIPKYKQREEENEGETSMEIDNNFQGITNESISSVPEQNQIKEFYLNSDGIICERIVTSNKDTPRTTRLKRSNSQRSDDSPIVSHPRLNAINRRIATPKSKRRNTHIPQIEIHTPSTSEKEIITEDRKSSTPRSNRRSSRRSSADTTLTEKLNDTVEELITPKIIRKDSTVDISELTSSKSRTNKKSLSTKKNQTITIESDTELGTPKSKRLKPISLNITKSEEDLDSNVQQPNSSKVKRTNSKSLRRTKTSFEEISTKVSSPILKRRNSKKLQENVAPNEQETDQNELSAKVSRISSLKRRNSKKYAENVNQKDSNKSMNEALTPNNRRKSLRITRASTKIED